MSIEDLTRDDIDNVIAFCETRAEQELEVVQYLDTRFGEQASFRGNLLTQLILSDLDSYTNVIANE